MAGLLRGIARTAIISGTATAVSNGVSRRQASRWAEQERQPEPQPQGPAPIAPAPPAQPTSAADPIVLLTQLADLHSKGLVTDDEFALQKQRILG